MLGQPLSMLIPEVIGFKLTGKLKEGVTATDLVLTVTQMLRKKGVVDKFVEFFGPGLDTMTLADRATIANMAPEYGATCGFFPVDEETLALSDHVGPRGRRASRSSRPIRKAQGLFRDAATPRPGVHRHAGARSRHRRALAGRPEAPARIASRSPTSSSRLRRRRWQTRIQEGRARLDERVTVEGRDFDTRPRRRRHRRHHHLHQHVEPQRADRRRACSPRNAVAKGLKSKPWVKTSLAPGSQVVTDYLDKAGLQPISTRSASTSSASAAPPASAIPGRCRRRSPTAINENDLVAAAVLSGNRNFEGRVNPDVQANYLASPPLVVAYALAGSVRPGPHDRAARHRQRRHSPSILKDIWPTSHGDPDVHRARTSRASCSSNATPTCSTATRTGAASRRARRPDLPLGRCARPTCRTRPTSRA